ncbi:MAG: hydrogenase expression/formation protein HypE [Candidatus Omnitrophica bacterium]|nr:hydrogenase expression/formation protein HypE [Candidatus Omnitrophota bacterium]
MKKEARILLSHGGGGKLAHQLIRELIIPNFSNPILNRLDDSAVFNLKGRLAFTCDSFVVKPLFFRGGDIGRLAVFGTVNDLAVMGAKPVYLSVGFIIEEGLEIKILEKIIRSMKRAAEISQVRIACGDLKVVEKNSADQIFINTNGIGVIESEVEITSSNAKGEDKIIINGFIGDHATAVMSARGDYKLKTPIRSDCAPLNEMIQKILKVCKNIHVMRDPTRGGVATTLNEIAISSNVEIEIYEDRLPIREEVKGFCEILGVDPLYMANEGKVIIFAPPKESEKILRVMQRHPLGRNASIIGRVTKKSKHPKVLIRTRIGSLRILDMLSGEQLPRIC